MRNYFLFIMGLVAIMTMICASNAFSQEEKIKKADSEFEKKNYSKARSIYLESIVDLKDSAKISRVNYKIGLCLIYLKETDEFLKYLKSFRSANKENVWQARSYYLEGLSQAYRYTYSQSAGAQSFDKARELYNKYRKSGEVSSSELLELNAILVDRLEESVYRNYDWDYDRLESDEEYKLIMEKEKESLSDEKGDYSSKWDARKKIVYLYRQLLSNYEKDKDKYYSVLYDMANYMRRVARTEIYKSEYKKLFKEIVSNCKDKDLSAKTMFVNGVALESMDELKDAVAVYESLIKEHPKSKWSNDAKYHLQEIRKPYINLSVDNRFSLKDTVFANLSSKNIPQIKFTLYEVDMQALLTEKMKSEDFNINDFRKIFKSIDKIKSVSKREILSWVFRTSYKNDYKYASDVIFIPDRLLDGKPGQYVLVAESNNVSSAAVIIVTDLAIVSRTANNEVHYWVTNSQTGKPVQNAKVITRFGRYEANPKIITDKSNELGRLTVSNSGKYSNITVSASNDKSFAATNDFYMNFYSRDYDKILKYTITDRPVYRPGQTVYFKHIIRSNSDGVYFPLKNKKVRVIIRDAKYQEIYKKELISNDFGSIFDKITLPDDAPLGVYNFSLFVIDLDNYENYTQGFRVEEYKRPEYQVRIEPVGEKLKVGQNIKIKIQADYYYGAPVANAEVEYTVKRSKYRHFHYPSNPFDWLYKGQREFYPWYWYYNMDEELVETKTAQLDANGSIILNYQTEDLVSKEWAFDYKYTVHANVKDASRRVIESERTIIVPKTEFNVFIKNDRGYITPGENAKFTFNSLNSNNQFIPAKGEIRIFKLIPVKNEKRFDSVLVKKDSFSIKQNKNEYFAKLQESGKYKIEFECRDVDNEKVFSELYFYVADKNFSGKDFYFDKIEVIPDKESYSEGDVMRLLINTDVENASIWLSIEAENKIFHQKVINTSGKSFIYEYKISGKDVPNIFVNAILVNDEKMFKEERQIMVPPDRQIIKITVESDKNEYKPGEKVNLKIKTLDYAGNPVKAEVSLSVFDASLLYIQDFMSQDIKKYFYGYLRYNNIQTINSFGLNISEISEDKNKYKEYKLSGLPDGFYRVSKFLRYFKEPEIYGDEEMKAGYPASPVQRAVKYLPITESADMVMSKADAPRGEGGGKKNGNNKEPENIQIRENFSEILTWNPVVQTDEKGQALISFDMNDALTKWQIETKAITLSSEVGESSGSFVSKKPFMLRPQTPRFLQEKDELVLSAVINNYSGSSFNATAVVEYDKSILTLVGSEKVKFDSKKDSDFRVDWKFEVLKKGSAAFIMKAYGDDHSDAVKFSLPVLEYGSQKTVIVNEEMGNLSEKTTEIVIPNDIRQGSQSLEITLNPSLATVVLSALPYLIEYPYGCFEQTLNRFIPLVSALKVMKDLNIDLYEVEEFNQKINKKYLGNLTKVFNKKEINKMVMEALKRIYDFQSYDGGFSWWKSMGSDHYMTSLGVTSLATGVRMGLDIRTDVIDRAVNFLISELNTKEALDLNIKTYMMYAVSSWSPDKINRKDLNELFKLRDNLTYYSASLLGLTYKNIVDLDKGKFNREVDAAIDKKNPLIKENINTGEFENLKIILSNLLDRIKIEQINNTAYWKPESGFYWRWYNDRIETTAMILRLVNSVNPEDEMLSKVVKWLINNRKGNTWHSTKDTGLLLQVLLEYIKTQGEFDVDYIITVFVDGKNIKELKIDKNNLFTFDNKIVLNNISTGKHTVRFEKKGKGNLNYTLRTDYFTREDQIAPAGNEIYIEREYFRLIKKVKKTDGKEYIEYDEVPLKNNELLNSGDEVRVRLTIDSKNDYEYLVFEDRKAAGTEFKLLKSWGGYMELRDEKALFFKNWLPQGKSSIQYDIRAEVPGKFNIMPSIGYAMYAPEIKANSASFKISIIDKNK